MVRSTPRSSSANAVGRRVFAPRWDRSETPTTTPWRRASSPRLNASCLIGVASGTRPRRAWPSSNSSRASIIRAGGTHRSDICHPSSSRASLPKRPSNPVHPSLPSCSRLSRNDLTTSQQVAPPAHRPSLTAARHDSLGNLQAGTKRCSRPNRKIVPKRRTECPQTRYPDPKTSSLHETGASPLTDNAKQSVVAVDSTDLKVCRLADPQTAGIHDGKAGSVDRVRYAAKQPADLGVGERMGQALLPRQADLFFENRAQSQLSVWQ